ncbi:amidase family protein [Acuticoccus sp.]|uniref:amidase family protein n=1 Tax=Acuticoccus sp. TaxID=1904378 RepID=UPI003B5191D5
MTPDPYGAFVERVATADGPRVAVKDMIAVEGLPQEAGLPVRAGRRASRDATVVARLKAAGYALAGVTVTDAAGFGTMTDAVENPRHPGRAVGGSSGGSAAAVAGGLAEVGLGTDTGGSVRIPAAYCDLLAYTPTRERAVLDGVLPLSPTFDVPGILAADAVQLAAAAPFLVEAWDPSDSTSPRFSVPDHELAVADAAVRAAFASIRQRLGAGTFASPVPYDVLAAAHSDIVCAEGFAVHRDDWDRAPDGFADLAASGIAYGATLDDRGVAEARRTASGAREAWRGSIQPDVILVLPTLPMRPAPRRTQAVEVAGVAMPITNANIRYTVPFSVAGLPVVVAPVDGLSVQFVGAAGRDEWLLATVHELVRVL